MIEQGASVRTSTYYACLPACRCLHVLAQARPTMTCIALVIIGRAGASPPSVTTWTRCLYNIIYIFNIYIYMVRPTGYRIFLNVSTRFFFTVTCRHFTGHNTALTGQGKPGFSEEERERRATESDETREARLRRTLERASCF